MVDNEGTVSEQTVESVAPANDSTPAAASEAPEVVQPKNLREKVQALKATKDAETAKANQAAAPKAEPVKPGDKAPAATQHQAAEPAKTEDAATKVEPTPAAYTPNLKYKFKGEEKPIPEFYHSLIKDEQSEKQVREILEKANWLDEEKPKLTQKVQEFETMNRGLQVLDQYISRDPQSGKVKDFGRFAKSFGLTDDDVLLHAQDILQYRTAPPEQRAQIDQERTQREEMERLRAENQQLQQSSYSNEAQVRETRLAALVQHPIVAPVVEKYLGGVQAFNRDVAQYAYLVEVQSQMSGGKPVILSPEQAVEGFLMSRGLLNQNGAQAPAPQAQQAPGVPQVQPQAAPVQQQQAPTLPKVTSQNSSPAKKVITNLKDLKKAAAQAQAAYSGNE